MDWFPLSSQNLANVLILCIGVCTSFLGTVITNYDKQRAANWQKLLVFELFSRANLAFVGYYGTILILVTVSGARNPGLFLYLMLLASLVVWVFVLLIAKEGSEHIDNGATHTTNSNDSVKAFMLKHTKKIVIGSFFLSFFIAMLFSLSKLTDIDQTNQDKPQKTSITEKSNNL